MSTKFLRFRDDHNRWLNFEITNIKSINMSKGLLDCTITFLDGRIIHGGLHSLGIVTDSGIVKNALDRPREVDASIVRIQNR